MHASALTLKEPRTGCIAAIGIAAVQSKIGHLVEINTTGTILHVEMQMVRAGAAAVA